MSSAWYQQFAPNASRLQVSLKEREREKEGETESKCICKLKIQSNVFQFIEYYKTSRHTERQTDLTTLVTYDNFTTTDSFSSIFYHTSERSLFTESDNLSPRSNQESFPSVTIAVSIGCLILIILFLTLLVCFLYTKH